MTVKKISESCDKNMSDFKRLTKFCETKGCFKTDAAETAETRMAKRAKRESERALKQRTLEVEPERMQF